MHRKELEWLEAEYTKGLTSQFFREDKPQTWLKPKRKPRVAVKSARGANTKKFCTSCGKVMHPPTGVTQEDWYRVRSCTDAACLKAREKSVISRPGKYCMNCGKFYAVRALLKRGVHGLGLNTWAACGCRKKK